MYNESVAVLVVGPNSLLVQIVQLQVHEGRRQAQRIHMY